MSIERSTSACRGDVLGAARAHRVPVVSQLAAIYVEIIRNTPILVQIFFLFFGLPQIGIILEPFTVAWLAVTAALLARRQVVRARFQRDVGDLPLQQAAIRHRRTGNGAGVARLAG